MPKGENKMKKPITIISVLLICLLSFSAMQLLSGNLASASTAPAVFCPNYFWTGLDTPNEISLSRDTCTYIRNMLTARYASGCYYSFDADCTVDRYRSILSTLNTYYTQEVVFSKGHRGVPYGNHFSMLDHNGNPLIDYADIYPRTSSKNTFTFIWHCQTSQNYPSQQDQWGWYGMPYCWTHNNGMNIYGTSGSQVYLGWWYGSPQFETTANGMWNFAQVAYLFWYAVCNGYTVQGALNYVATTVYGQTYFSQTPLNYWLVAWGNTNMYLPY
jgi:hypothetical protein